MYTNTWFQQLRFPLQSIQILQKAIVSQMLALQDNPKDRPIAQNRIKNFLSLIHTKAKDAAVFLKQQTALKKQQLSIIQGQKAIKNTQKKKTSDVIWQNFYDKVKQIKQLSKKQQGSIISNMSQPQNTQQYFKKIVFMPPFKQPEFSSQQNKGRYVDMHQIYNQFLNLCKAMDSGNKEQTSAKFHDYLWFLQNMDKFDDFPVNRKFKHQHKYLTYLEKLEKYLSSFIIRSRPLFDFFEFMKKVDKKFEEQFQQGHMPGWQFENDNFNTQEALYCPQCKKLFINNEAYVSHSASKKHQKMFPADKINQHQIPDPQEQKLARQEFKESHYNRKKSLAIHQFRIQKMRQQLASPIYDTMNLVRKKQTRGYEDIDEIVDSQSDEQQDDAPIYNPKNLPLGWDGKPIPYWLYKLHGLGIEYKCQICGNFSYWGRRAFEMHFQQWRHNYGMRCLKIPNTIHFKDITTISDALALHEKLMKQSHEAQFRPDMQQQFQDNQGNVLNKRTYFDMKKQGLLD